MTALFPRLALRTAARTSFRTFSTSRPAYDPSSKDPEHPLLWYHPLATFPPKTALSFLPTPPMEGSRTVLGYLPSDSAAGLRDFKEEPRFLPIMHAAIKSGLEMGKGETVDFEAATRPGDGFIHITDERAIPPAGRIGETEDLIGSVFVQDGKVIASTYEALPSYRLLTSNGPLILPRGLDDHLMEELKRIDEEEKKTAK